MKPILHRDEWAVARREFGSLKLWLEVEAAWRATCPPGTREAREAAERIADRDAAGAVE